MPAGTLYATCPPRFDPNHFADARWSAFLHQDPKSGRLYAAFNDWTRDWCDYADSFMHQWSPAGASTWTVGTRGVPPVLPGEIHTHLRGVAGVAHGCIVAIDVNGGWYGKDPALTYVWDQDGLYVGGLMDAIDLNGIEKHWYQCGGEFCHASVHALPSGDVLFYGNWENEMRIYRISGWKDWTRRSGTIRLARASVARTGQGLAASYFDDAGMTKLRSMGVEPRIDLTWSGETPAVPAVRWAGTVQPDYGPSYVGPWSVRSDKECFEGGTHGSRDDNASMTYRFRGTSINVFGTAGPNFGFADITLDGKPEPRADCYSAQVKRNVSLFEKTGLANGDHELTVKVVGWYGKPRNKASSDSWVMLDKFVVDGREIDDAGVAYTFSANGDGKLQLWVNRQPVIHEDKARNARAEVQGKIVKLLRRANPIQLNYLDGSKGGGVRLHWSSPFEQKQLVPTKCLYPVSLGGYTMETLK